MQNDFETQAGGIVLKERNEIKPSEITLGYLVNEKKMLNPIIEHEYDINIHRLNFNKLNFLESSENLIELIHSQNFLSIDKIYQFKLLDLSSVGIGLAPQNLDGSDEESSRYRYLQEFIQCANEAIRLEKRNEKKHNDIWNEQYHANLKKFDAAQCKNKINIAALYSLKKRLRALIKQIDKLIAKKDADKISKFIEESYCFTTNKLFIWDEYLPNIFNKKVSLFKQLSMNYDGRLNASKHYSIKELNDKLNSYRYIFNAFYYFLSSDLKIFKQKKIKKATDCFLTDLQELKRIAINNIKESDYEELNRFDLATFYDWYRNSIIGHLNKIIDADIKRRKVADGIFQYTPSASGVILFFVSLGLSFTYTFTLLKEMWERHVLMIIFACISICAVIALINLYRNAKVFKRPKRKKFSIYSLAVYLVITIVFFSLNMYYIHRYDGYNTTYYYVYDEQNEIAIVIDGLRDENKTTYQLPEKIDDLTISSISDKVFKGNTDIIMVDLSKTRLTTLSEDCFLGCSNLEKVVLPETLTTISKNAFKNCSNLQTVSAKNNVTQIEPYAFSGCVNLKSIDLSNVIKLGNNAFENCNSIGLVTFNSNLTNIPAASFKNCTSLSFTTLPKNLLTIGDEAFEGCGTIKELTIPVSTTNIGKEAFTNCYNIQTVDIANYNAIKNGDLYSVFGKLNKLTKVVLDNVSSIPSNSFAFSPNVQSISIGGNVLSIGENAFKDCAKLVSCNISGNINRIDARAFYNCNSLKELVFNGLSLSEICEETFYNCSSLETFNIPNTVQTLGDKAFYGCSKFTDVIIPSTVSKIGNNVFSGCSGLRTITLPISSSQDKLSNICDDNVVKALSKITVTNSQNIPNSYFENCINLSTLTLDSEIQSIGSYAFKNCSNLSSFNFVSAATQIGEGAFYGCKKLSSIELNASINIIPNYVFYNCIALTEVYIPNGVKTIGSYSYANCSQLKSVSLSKNISEVGDNAFDGCFSLQEIRIPLLKKSIKDLFGESVTNRISKITVDIANESSLPDYYFSDCYKLNTIVFNGKISSIGKYAFNGCSSLQTLDIENSVTKIDDYAFNNCSKLSTISIPSSVSHIGNSIFNGCNSIKNFQAPIANTKSFENYFSKSFGSGVESIILLGADTIPDSYFEGFVNLKSFDLSNYKHIGANAFNNSGLSTLTIPNNVVSVGKGAFSNCNQLKTVEIKSSLDLIPESLFAGCSYLETVKIPASIEEIGANAFSNCTNLSSLNEWSNIRRINAFSFENCKKLKGITLDKIVYLGENALSGCNLSNELSFSIQASYAQNALNNVTGVKSITINCDFFSENIEFYLGNTTSLITQITISNLSNLNEGYFNNCSNVESIIINGDLKTIGKNSFSGLTKLVHISLPDSIEAIKEYAFKGCSNLTDVNMPTNIKVIEKYAFYDCINLSSIELTNNIEYIGKQAFNENTKVGNSDSENQLHKVDWHKNWDSQRPVTFKTVMEDIVDFVVKNYIVVIICTTLMLAMITVIIITKKIKKKRTK